MTSPIFDVLSRTLAAVSPDSGPAVLETAARGTVTTRARFRRREIVQDLRTGAVGILTAEVLASVPVADAQGVEVGDIVWTRDKLWKVSSPLDDGGENIVLQLIEAQKTTALLDDDSVEVVVVGDPDGTAPVVALAPSGVLRRSDVVSLDGDSYRVGTPTDWPAGGLRRYLLTPV